MAWRFVDGERWFRIEGAFVSTVDPREDGPGYVWTIGSEGEPADMGIADDSLHAMIDADDALEDLIEDMFAEISEAAQ